MGTLSIWHLLIVLVVVLVLFGKGKIANVMGEMGQGIKSFKKGLTDEEAAAKPAANEQAAKSLESQAVKPADQPGVQSKAG
jgi:sec-independent protein translocase protein TatA